MIKIIGIGNKCRQGKDEVAKFIKEFLGDKCLIVHFADALYKEVSNQIRKYPLILRDNGFFFVFDKFAHDDNTHPLFRLCTSKEVPFLESLFHKRGIKEYWGMNEKDPEILQFFGTDFRRELCSKNYWIQQIEDFLKEKCKEDTVVAIPDVRFSNEYFFVKQITSLREPLSSRYRDAEGIYLNVKRLNSDGSQFISTDRNPNHPSEIDLDETRADYLIEEYSGNLNGLKQKTLDFLKTINCL